MKTTAENVTGKCKTSNSRWAKAPCPSFRRPQLCNHLSLAIENFTVSRWVRDCLQKKLWMFLWQNYTWSSVFDKFWNITSVWIPHWIACWNLLMLQNYSAWNLQKFWRQS